MAKITEHPGYVVLREESGRAVTRVIAAGTKKETFRALLNRVTGNGAKLYENLLNIANGEPHVYVLPDGRQSEPVVPSIETQRAANKDLIEFLHGKAVAQTEVVKAEEEAQQVEQLRAMSDDELWAIANRKVKELRNGDEHGEQPERSEGEEGKEG